MNKIPINFAVFTTGLFFFCVGAWLVYPPAAFLGAGVILMGISLFGRGTK